MVSPDHVGRGAPLFQPETGDTQSVPNYRKGIHRSITAQSTCNQYVFLIVSDTQRDLEEYPITPLPGRPFVRASPE